MRIKTLESPHGVKQYTFRINEKEIESLLVVIEMARAYTPRSPGTEPLKEIRRHVNIANREMKKAIKELADD